MKKSETSRPGFQAPFGLVVSHSVLITLFLGLIASTLGSLIANQIIRREETQRFEMARQDLEDLVKNRFSSVLGVLQHTRAFLTTKERVSRQDFRVFLASVDLPRAYPGVLGIGFGDRVTALNKAAHERDVREDGYPRYHIWPKAEHGVSYLYPVKFLEPFDSFNKRILGYDMHTEPRRAATMDHARDSGLPGLTPPVELLQDDAPRSQPGFLLYLPVYRRGIRVDTAQERRWALLGFLYAPIRAFTFFRDLYQQEPVFKSGIGMRATANGQLIFDTAEISPEGAPVGNLNAEHQISLYGQQWTVKTFVTKGFASSADRFAPLFVFFAGLLITILACCVTYITGRQAESQRERAAAEQAAREQLQEAAREREGNLRIQERLLRIAQVVSAELDLDKVAQAVTDAATNLSGARFGAFFYGPTGDETTPGLTVSGISREAFDHLPMPRDPAIFHSIPSGARAIRRDDLSLDHFMTDSSGDAGPAVRSYLAVPVISRQGEILGGILLAHDRAGVFGEREEKVVLGLAAQAAIAIDNARLFKKAREAVETRDEFLSICSHELRTPLTSMKLQNQLAQRNLQAGLTESNLPRFGKMVEQSGRQIDRLVRLIEEMLDISRIRSGKLSILPERLDLTQLVQEIVERFQPQLQEAGCRVRVSAPPSLMGTWDRLRLEQVLVNLLSNAMKYGAGKPIHVDLRMGKGAAVLSVRDEGIGIAPEHQARIFERFERAVAKAEISGLGLGLYIVSQILDLQGGSIRVESALGQGSRFVVELPLETAASHASPPNAAGPRAELT